MYIGTSPETTDQAKEGMRKAVESLRRETVPAAELARGKSQLQGEYYRDHQSLSSRSSEAAILGAQGLPVSLNQDQIAQAQRLTAEDVRAIARKYLVWDKAYVVTVGP